MAPGPAPVRGKGRDGPDAAAVPCRRMFAIRTDICHIFHPRGSRAIRPPKAAFRRRSSPTLETVMCATRHSATAVTTSGPDRQPAWLFDLQDHQLIQLVNSFVAARHMDISLSQPEEGLHPRGIIKLTTDPGMRIARSVIILLESLEAGGPQERLRALRRLHDEVLYSALSSLQKNTARVLIQIMKDLVRAAPHVHAQLPLAHDFYQAVRGTPHVIRSLLRRYHLLEMPEAWNQQAFDHHVHDANTKGRKSPTHLVMDAWVKGLRFLTVIYYNTVDPGAASELLRAARIMGITVRIGIEFRAAFHDRLIELTWSPLNVNSSRAFIKLLQRPDIAAILEEYAEVNRWMRRHVLCLLDAWNGRHAAALAGKLGLTPPPPLVAEDFLHFVGQRQPSSLHLAEYILQQWQPALEQAREALHADPRLDGRDGEAARLRAQLEALEGLMPDTLRQDWLGPQANPDIVFPLAPHKDLPPVLLRAPEALLQALVPLHPCQMILGLEDLDARDVLELLWRGKGLITHLELFNLRTWSKGQLQHVEAINTLQRAINEGSPLRLKQVVRQIVQEEPADSPRRELLLEVQDNLLQLRSFYELSWLGSRVGTDSTSRSHMTHGMGLIFTETLPPQARAALRREKSGQRLTLPVHTDIYGFTHYHEPAVTPGWLQGLRRLPLLHHLGCRVVRGWGLEKKTTTISPDGNLVTLGGVDARGINAEQHDPVRMMRHTATAWNVHYFNSNLVNLLKIVLGFIPAQWAFWYVDSWWILTWIGALLWFAITAVRNVLQSMVGGGAFCRSMLLSWNRYVSWSRMADSLLYTGISVPLLEVVVRMWLLEDWLGITVQTSELAVYTVIAMVNSVYISGHNIFRGLPKEAVVGNLFRSAVSIPLSIVLGKGLLLCFFWLGIADPVGALQNCAAIVSKCSSDIVAAVIEGFADRNMYLRMRTLEYDGKFSQIFSNLVRLAMLFPQATIRRLLLEQPAAFWRQLLQKDQDAARQAIVHLLDLMYMWYYLPRSRDVFWRRLDSMPTEEVQGILALHSLLPLQREITTQVLDGLLGDNFANALAFYLRQQDSYCKEVLHEAARRGHVLSPAA